MKICNNVQQIKLYAEVNATFEPENLLPSESKVVHIVKDILSDAEYNSLQLNYTNNTLTAEQNKLLPYVQNAMVCLSMIKYIGACGQAEISNAGIHLNLSKDRKTVFQWQIIDIKKHFKTEAYTALENLLHFLWQSDVSEYLLWRVSDNRNEYLKFFINDATEFSKAYNIHGNFAFYLYLRDTIDFVEEQYIEPVIGSALFTEIKSQILNNTVSANNSKILKWIRKAVAYKTIYHAIPKLMTYIDEFGIQESFLSLALTADATQAARNEFVSYQLKESETNGESYLLKLRRYLIDNATDYPLYVAPAQTNLSINKKDSGFFTVL